MKAIDEQSGGDAVRTEHIIIAGLMGAMALIAFINVLGRYIFHYSLAFTEEVTINLFVWMVVVGSGVAFERGGQLGMVTVVQRLSPKYRRLCARLGLVLSTLLFLALDVLLVANIRQELTLFHARSAALGIPVWIYYAGVVLLSPFVFRGIIRGWRRVSDGEGGAY